MRMKALLDKLDSPKTTYNKNAPYCGAFLLTRNSFGFLPKRNAKTHDYSHWEIRKGGNLKNTYRMYPSPQFPRRPCKIFRNDRDRNSSMLKPVAKASCSVIAPQFNAAMK